MSTYVEAPVAGAHVLEQKLNPLHITHKLHPHERSCTHTHVSAGTCLCGMPHLSSLLRRLPSLKTTPLQSSRLELARGLLGDGSSWRSSHCICPRRRMELSLMRARQCFANHCSHIIIVITFIIAETILLHRFRCKGAQTQMRRLVTAWLTHAHHLLFLLLRKTLIQMARLLHLVRHEESLNLRGHWSSCCL